MDRSDHPIQTFDADCIQEQGDILHLSFPNISVEGSQDSFLEIFAVLLSHHEGSLVCQIPIAILNGAPFVTFHAGKGMEIEDRGFSFPLPERILGGCGNVDGEMVSSFPGVFGADVAFVIETIVLDADAGHGNGGDVVHWLLDYFAKSMESCFY